MKKYDIGIIGSGPGGYKAALRASSKGKSVCLFEKNSNSIGGVCLNKGCIPTKSIINSVDILGYVKNAGKYGINIDLKNINMPEIVAQSENIVKKLKHGLLYLLKSKNIDILYGKAELKDKNKISLETPESSLEYLEVKNIIIATGSIPKVIPELKTSDKVLTSSEIISLNYIPRKLLIVGGGSIGIEFAYIFNSLGSEVIIVELMDSVLPFQDKDLTDILKKSFQKRGIKIHINTKLEKVDVDNEKVRVELDKNGEFENIDVDLILMAIGRVPNTEMLGLEKLGIELDEKGFIKVNKKMQTSVSNIYAVGDVINTPMLAHAAYKEAEIAIDEIVGNSSKLLDYDNVPNVVYCKPEVASIGLSEQDVKNKDIKYKSIKHFYKANPKAVINEQEEGFVKVIIEEKSKKILGVQIFGVNAAEMIHNFLIAKKNNIDLKELSKIAYAHPTFSEMIPEILK